MRAFSLLLAAVPLAAAAFSVSVIAAEPPTGTFKWAVVRNGDQIGMTELKLRREGKDTIAEVNTRIQVKIAFVTVYRYEQTEMERWSDGHLVALSSTTNDNGTPHKVVAKTEGNRMIVEADGKTSQIERPIVPVSLWNPALLQKTTALDPQNGTMVKVAVTDHGEEQVDLKGRATKARHYSIKTSFPQDVWYDANQHLVRVELHGSDGSRIEYQPS